MLHFQGCRRQRPRAAVLFTVTACTASGSYMHLCGRVCLLWRGAWVGGGPSEIHLLLDSTDTWPQGPVGQRQCRCRVAATGRQGSATTRQALRSTPARAVTCFMKPRSRCPPSPPRHFAALSAQGCGGVHSLSRKVIRKLVKMTVSSQHRLTFMRDSIFTVRHTHDAARQSGAADLAVHQHGPAGR